MATPNPSSDCSDSEQSHMKINSPESLAGDDLPDSHTFHKETKTTLKGNVCHQETTTFHEGYVVGSSVNGHPTVEGPEDTGSLGRCMDNNSDTTKDNPNQAHIQMYPDVEEDEETDSDSEGEVADQIVTNNNKWINKNLRLRGLYIDPVDGWPVIQLVSPKLTKEQAPEDSHNEERKEESESSEDEYGDADKLIENFKDQDEGMLMGLIEKEKEDTKIKNNEDTWSDDEEYVDLYERMLVYKISDDTRLPDSSEDDGRQLNESSLEKENIPDNEDPQDADKQTYDSDKDDALWLREPPEGNFQLGSSSPPHPAQVPCEEHHTCEDLPTCKPPENTQVTQVPEMPAMLPEDEPAEPQDLTETEYNYNFMATPNPSSDCSDSEQSHMKINFPESLVGGDLPDSHTFHKETKTTLKGNVCHQETTTFHEGYVVGSSVNGRTTVEGPEDTQSLGRCMDNNSDTTKDNPNQARIQMYPDVEEDEETDSDSEGEGADQIVTNNNKWINKNLRLRGLYTDPVDSWPVIQLVSPKLTEEQAPEDSHNEERKEESESSEDEHGDADKLIENFKDQEEGMLMGLTEKEKEDTKIKNNEDTWSDDEEYVDLYERMLVYKISDDTRLPDSSEDDGRQLNESSLEKENIPDNEDPQDADKQTYDSDKDDALWLREPPEGNFQLGSSSPPHPAQVPCEEHHTCEDLPTCKPPENTQVTQVPEMPAMLPEDEPAEPQDLTETEYNYNFMATPNPSSDCSDSEQSHMKINFPESLVGGDLPDSHTFHKETKTTLKGNVCHQETTTFHEGYVVGSSVNGHTTVEGPEDTQSLGRCMDNNSDTTKDNPNQARIQMYPDVEEDEETDSDSEGEGADQIVTNNNKWINKNLRLRGLYTDPVDSWPVIQLVSPKLTEEQAPEDSHNEERKEESESSEDEHGDADKLIENFKDQDEGMLMGLTEKEKEDTKIKNNEDTWSDDEEYVDLYERTLVYKISDDTRLPDSSEDDGRQLNESSLEKENIPDNEDPQDADKQTYDSDKNDALWLREPPEGNFQLGSSSPPHPAQVPCEEHHTCEDLPTCKPPENTQVTQVPEMPAMLPEDEPAEPQDLTETEYNYNFMATPNPSSDCSDSEQSHMKINFPESLVGGDLPDSHTFHKETKTTLKGNVCHQETTTFHEGYVVGSSVNGRTTVEGPEDTQSLGRCMDNNSDTTKDNPNQARIQMYPDVEEDEETDSDSEGEGADQIVTNNNKWINKNLRLRELYTDPVDSWPVIQLVSPKLTKEQAPEDSHNEERKEESESSEDEYGDADKLIENFKDQDEGMLMGLIEKEKEDTKIKNNEDTWSDDEEYVDLYERMLVYKISDDTRLPDSSEDDGRQLNESSLEKENIPDNEDPQDADKQTYDSDKDDALWLREPPEGNFQLGSSSPPHPAQVPCEEHHTCEDLPTCKPPENTQVTQVPEMPAMLPEDEPAEPQDLTETEYNYNFMATPNPSSDCSDSEQSHMKINFPESLVGGDLPDSHTFHKETKTTLKGNVCHQETTTFHEGYVVGSSVNGRTTVEGPEDTQSLGRCMDNNSDTTKDNPNQARIQMYPDVEEDEETDSDSEGEGADQIVTNNNKWINKNLRLRGLYTDPVDSWPVIQLVSPKLTEEQAPEDSHNEERKEESESSEDEHGDADKLIENFKDQEEGMLMGLTEKEKEDTKIKNNEDTWSDDEEYVDLYERMLVYKISDDTRLPDSSEDDGRQLNESSLEKENIPDNEDPQDADKQTYDSDKDDALWLREPPEGNFQLGSSSPPHPAQVPCEEHHTCEDLPTCKPPENTQVTQVPEMPAMLPEDEPAEMLKTSTKESSSVSLGESEDDDTGSDTQTTTCVNWRQAFRWLRKRVLSCMGRRVTVRNPPATPTKKSLPTSKETHPKETLSD